MTYEDSYRYWKYRHELVKDYRDRHWGCGELRENIELCEHMKNAYEALEKIDRYKWHDLCKNPEDLPNHLERIIFKTNESNEFNNGYFSGEYDSFSKVFFNDDKQRSVLLGGYNISDVIAWKRIEPFEVTD